MVHKLLVIEDDNELCQELRDILEDEGFDVTSACDGDTGFEYASRGGFDLILLDLKLPGRSGVRILQDLRAKGDNTHVVVMTGHPFGTSLPEQEGLEDGMQLEKLADHVINKPFAIPELLHNIKGLLARR
jgi:DNA-binding response OmpR family regulator